MSAPNLKEIEWAISELEKEDSSKSGYILLAALYTCRDAMLGSPSARPQIAAYSEAAPAAEALGQYGDSDFLRAVAGANQAAAWGVMNELMETLQVINRRAYESVMRKLRNI